MFSFSNGILRIKKDRPGLDLFIDFSFLLLICAVFTNGGEEGESYFYYITFFLFFGLTCIKLLTSLKTQGGAIIPAFTLWYGGFTLLSLMSALWATNPQTSLKVISRLIQSLVITFAMSQNYATRAGLFRCMRMFSWAGAFVAVYALANTPFDEWFKGFLGWTALSLNPNTVGMIFTICLIISLYFALYCNEKRYYLVTVLQLFIIILTSSRKSLLASVAGMVMMGLMRIQRRNVVPRVLMTFGLVIALSYLIMSVPEFYRTIGGRFESMTEYLLGEGGDYSISLRQRFIENAQDMFFERPILGYGINNFAVQIGRRIDVWTYAHNNYYEILADLGIVGFTLFYGYYFYLLATLAKAWRKTGSSMAKMMLALLVVIMICEYGLVSYYSIYMQMALCCMYLFTCAINNVDDHSSGTPIYLKYKQRVYG